MRLITALALLVATATLAHAQAVPPQSCEQQLDMAASANLRLQKELLQAQFQAVTLQEQMRDMQKKQAEAPKPAPKSAEKK